MLLVHFSRPRAYRRGTVACVVAACLTVMMGAVAFALDGGTVFAERRHAQAVADAAAMAGACHLYDNYWTYSGVDVDGKAAKSAERTAAANGYANDGIVSKVTVHIPPLTGNYVGKPGFIEVEVEYYQTRNFSNIFSSEPITVKARAVALGAPVAADVGILVLDPHAKGALNSQGGGSSVVVGTPIIVDSDHAEAAIAGGGGSLTAEEFVITGGYSTAGGGQFIGTMSTGRPPTPDPLADVPPPNPTKLPVGSNSKTMYTSGTHTLSPGVYKGGIKASGTASLVMTPGIYYMDGGGFEFTGQGSLTALGVMIYNAPTNNGQNQGVTVTGQGTINVSGPPEGLYHGITFWQDRNSNATGEVQGSGDKTSITGTFYFAGALLKITGNGGVSNLGSQYISRKLELGGTGAIEIEWKPYLVARKRTITMVE